jgi:hypothetical protein
MKDYDLATLKGGKEARMKRMTSADEVMYMQKKIYGALGIPEELVGKSDFYWEEERKRFEKARISLSVLLIDSFQKELELKDFALAQTRKARIVLGKVSKKIKEIVLESLDQGGEVEDKEGGG